MDLVKDKYYLVLDGYNTLTFIIKAENFSKAIAKYVKHIQLNPNCHKKLLEYINLLYKPITLSKFLEFMPYWSKGSYIINSESLEVGNSYEVVEEFSNIKIEDIVITKDMIIL